MKNYLQTKQGQPTKRVLVIVVFRQAATLVCIVTIPGQKLQSGPVLG